MSLGVYRISDPRIFTESIFSSAFGNAAMESYMEVQDSYGSLFVKIPARIAPLFQ